MQFYFSPEHQVHPSPYPDIYGNIVSFKPICPPQYNCDTVEYHGNPYGSLYIHHITNDQSVYGKQVPITFHAMDSNNVVKHVLQTEMTVSGKYLIFCIFAFSDPFTLVL